MERRLLLLADKLGIKNLLRSIPMKFREDKSKELPLQEKVITQPQLLLADEPTGALDSKAAKELLKLFTSLNQDGQTILMVTHSVRQQAQQGGFYLLKTAGYFIRFTKETSVRYRCIRRFPMR